jgi:hypothetical protein
MKKNPKQEVDYNKKNFIDQNLFYDMIQDQVNILLNSKDPSLQSIIANAKLEKWLGNPENKKCYKGLLGYARLGFALQIKILKNIDNNYGCFMPEFYNFFKSPYFKDEVLNNNKIVFFYKNEHLDKIRDL